MTMRRKAVDETVARMPSDHVERSETFRDALTDWALENSEAISNATLDGPTGASNRAQDNWASLVRVAAAIGGDWPDRALKAFAKLEIKDKDRDTCRC